jgi:hypothetical protein
MGARRKISAGIGLLLIVSIVAFYRIAKYRSEPAYDGKSTSDWISLCSTNLQKSPPLTVVRGIGTNAMPVLARHLKWAKPETYRWWENKRHSRARTFINQKLGRYEKADVAYKWLGVALREVPFAFESMILTFDTTDVLWILRSRQYVGGSPALRDSLLQIEWNSSSDQAKQRAKRIREELESTGLIPSL